MEESQTNKKESKRKSILSSKISKGKTSKKANKHLSISDNKENNGIITEKNNKNKNLLFSKFDLFKDFMKAERKAFSIKMKNLSKINLKENKIDNLYKWENLFNNFNSIKSYTSLKKPKNKGETKNEIKENSESEYESPILLVDLPESQMNLFFRRKNIRNVTSLTKDKDLNLNFNKNNHNIRPVSMYSPRTENSCFYYSNTFSDYYKEDFKSFCEKFPLLKAKLKIKSEKIKKKLSDLNLELINKCKILEKKRKEKTTEFSKLHLIIAGARKNPIPLVKNAVLQKYYSNNNFNENKNDNLNGENSLNLYNNRHKNKFKKHLLLSYYDVNDPLISLFNKEVNNNNNKDIKNNINQTNVNKTENNNKEYKMKETFSQKEEDDIQINKYIEKKHKKKKKSKNDKIKLKLNLFNKNININKDIVQPNIPNLIQNNLTTSNSINNINYTQEYSLPNTFPLKTSSDVGNISYNNIKKFIKQKIFLNKFKFNDSIPQTTIDFKTNKSTKGKSDLELILDSKKIKPKKTFSLFDSIFDKKYQQKIHCTWDKNGNLLRNNEDKKCNVIYFNQCIKNKFNDDLSLLNLKNDNNYFKLINVFNKGNIKNYTMKNKKSFPKKEDNENNKDIFFI